MDEEAEDPGEAGEGMTIFDDMTPLEATMRTWRLMLDEAEKDPAVQKAIADADAKLLGKKKPTPTEDTTDVE